MTNKGLEEIYAEIEDRGKALRELKHYPSGVAMIDLLQELHNVVLMGLINTPASEVARVAEHQGRYKIIHALLNQILEEDDAESG